MDVVAKLFEEFDERVLAASGITPGDHPELWRDMKRSFYGGTRAMFDLLAAATETAARLDWPEEKGAAFLRDIDEELRRFSDDMLAGRQ